MKPETRKTLKEGDALIDSIKIGFAKLHPRRTVIVIKFKSKHDAFIYVHSN